jgi:membrane protein implicated in regulation of membrane protease activity
MTAVVVFLIIGGFALLLLLLSLVGGGHLHLGHLHLGHLHLGHLHLGHLHLGHFHLGHAHVGQAGGGNGGAELSLPVIAGFLGAFGFGGAIVESLLPNRGGTGLLVAVVVGLLAAVPTGWLAGRLVNAAMNMSTDATLTSNDLLGTVGVVITPVPVGGYGEVRLAVAGQQIKFNARSDQPLALGTRVFVIEVPTPTSVLVEPTPPVG